ncbi:MAG: twin-arginine translocase subunit TatC [Vicinamibacterales bacterium]
MALVPFPNKAAVRDPDDDDPDSDLEAQDEDSGRMSFLEHLDELRKRIIWSIVSVMLGFGVAIFYVGELFTFIMQPMQRMLPAGQTLIYTDPGEAFFLQIKIALIAGLIVASPLVFTQVWLFIAPGLYSHEKKLAIPFVLMSTFFFAAGAAFAHFVVFPIVWQFFVGFNTPFLTFTPRVEPAFSMYLRLILAMGITFELPTLVLFLARMGLASPRFMIRNIKYAVLVIILAAAVLSPDGSGVGLVAMGGPVLILYIFSIGLAWAFGKKKKPLDDDAA